jgi:alditol oxidase
MKKRTFLKMSSAALTGATLSSMNGCKQTDTAVAPTDGTAPPRLKNWAGNLEYGTQNVVYPESVEQVQAFVKKADKLRVLGSQHCFNKIADSPHQLLSTKSLNKVVALDPIKKTVTVEAGIRYWTL